MGGFGGLLVLYLMAQISIVRFVKTRSDVRVYNADDQEYWLDREIKETDLAIQGNYTKRLYRKQSGQCVWCNEQFTKANVEDKQLHIHHLKPVSLGGNWSHSNLKLIHSECHAQVHKELSLEDMARYADKGINYLALIKVGK